MFGKLAVTLGRGWCASGTTVITAKGILSKKPLINTLINCNFSYCRSLSVSTIRMDLMEFFDNKKNWGESSVRVGRSWKVEELRLKSNTDLHKLWYVLLKEKNMLLTMEHECKQESRYFPNPERIDKVEDSMKNLEEVVRERNRAYFMLETGESGERPGAEEENFLGLPEYEQHMEHAEPKQINKLYLKAKSEEPVVDRKEKQWFLARWGEKQQKMKRLERMYQKREVQEIIKRFPNVDIEALKEKFPNVYMQKYIDDVINGKHLGNVRPKNFYGHTTHF